MTLVDESDALHRRVRAFARAGGAGASFDGLAVDIARHQAKYVPGFRRLLAAHGSDLRDAASIPAVPVDAFRLARVAAHPPELDEVRFETSGTTGGARGVHVMRTTETYRELSLLWGTRSLGGGPCVVVALAPDPGAVVTSSLAFMMRAFMQTLDGRSLQTGSSGGFEDDANERWLVGPGGADVAGLGRAIHIAQERSEPLVVLSTSFALVALHEARPSSLSAPPDSVVMTTGGFKGRAREVEPAVLAERTAALFGIAPERVVGEYGMTELTSQLYERGGARGVFFPPPWLRVTPVDPTTLEPTPSGDAGLARFVDLGNVDSAVAVVTEDLVRLRGGGIELLGRKLGAPARGCSLAIEEMVLGSSGAP